MYRLHRNLLRLDYKTTKNFKEAAEKFVSKHGALHQESPILLQI